METINQLYLRQIGLGVKRSFFAYFYTDEMQEEEKMLIDEKVKLAIEYLKTRLKVGYEEYNHIYNENYQFIIGVLVSNEATRHYYKFKKTIQELIDFYTLEELQEIVRQKNYDALLGMCTLPKHSFFAYFYTENMTEEEKIETNEKIKLAIEHEKNYFLGGYNIFSEIYNAVDYTRIGIKIIDDGKINQFYQFVARIISLIEPYSLQELHELCEDDSIILKQLQLK